MLRPQVMAFAHLMECNLRKHDADRGPHGWQDDGAEALVERLEDEATELDRAIQEAMQVAGKGSARSCLDVLAVAKEAADVANFAMMIADVSGGLELAEHQRTTREKVKALRKRERKPEAATASEGEK